MDVALVKYRVAAVQTPNSPQLWNNIGHYVSAGCFLSFWQCVVWLSIMCRDVFFWQAQACGSNILSEEGCIPRWVMLTSVTHCPVAHRAEHLTCNASFAIQQFHNDTNAGPFEWIVSYNLGLLHLATGQYASAFHHFSSSINTKSDFAHTYMYLAVALAKLDDVDNASAAYEKALELDDDMMFRLNYGRLYQRFL